MTCFRLRTLGGLTTALYAALLAAAPATNAHPLGNFTINHYNGLRLHPDHVEDTLVVDSAEIAAAQERPRVDTDHDDRITRAERATYARDRCTERARALAVTIDGTRLEWTIRSSAFTQQPGEAGLKTSRLYCELTAPADLRQPATVQVRDHYDSKRVGWHEMTATGHGVALEDSPLATSSITDELRDYPEHLLASPLDQRRATLRAVPDETKGRAAVPLPDFPGTGPVTTALEQVRGLFHGLVGTRELTLPVGLLALLLATLLGASHAALPGHGKTIMAAYLAGRRGRARDAVTVGATVTATHTAGVLVLGIVLPVATNLAGETVLAWLGLASGLLVTAIGIGLLHGALRKRPPGHHHHSAGHHDRDDHGHAHHHAHPHLHSTLKYLLLRRTMHSPAPDHNDHARQPGGPAVPTRENGHPPTPAARSAHRKPSPTGSDRTPRPTRRTLVGLGIAGGLVPSPSALIVLLGAIALGRTPFGVLLVLGYGVGMAATLTVAGLLLIRVRDKLSHTLYHRRAGFVRGLKQAAHLGPALTASLVLAVGLSLTLRALTTT